jgi:hypothetical protein
MNELPQIIEDDERTGRQCYHEKVGTGLIVQILRFEDGFEQFIVDLGGGLQYQGNATDFAVDPEGR